MFNALKDRATGALAKRSLTGRIARYGKITALQLDSSQTNGHLVGVIKGKEQSARINVPRYTVRKEAEETQIRIDRVICDRTWVHRLLNDPACKQWFTLSGWAAAGF